MTRRNPDGRAPGLDTLTEEKPRGGDCRVVGLGSGHSNTTTRRLTVTCSGPARELHPNWRGHWAPKARAVKDAREEARIETMFRLDPRRKPPRTVALKRTFYVPDNRGRDVDGLEHSTKAHADGIADALGVNDRLFRWLPSEVVVERGRREVTFEIELEVGE